MKKVFKGLSPTPPENVQFVSGDGERIAADCIYLGWIEGMHQWRAIQSIPLDWRKQWTIECSMLPAKTSITVGIEKPKK